MLGQAAHDGGTHSLEETWHARLMQRADLSDSQARDCFMLPA